MSERIEPNDLADEEKWTRVNKQEVWVQRNYQRGIKRSELSRAIQDTVNAGSREDRAAYYAEDTTYPGTTERLRVVAKLRGELQKLKEEDECELRQAQQEGYDITPSSSYPTNGYGG